MPQSYEIDLVHPALDLVNSRHGRGPDLLKAESWFGRYRERWGFAPAGAPTDRERARLVELRALLRRIVEALDEGAQPAPADLDGLDRALAATSLRRTLAGAEGPFEVRLVPKQRDWRWVESEIAASFAELLATSDAERIKICDNPECRFAFYDASKNRSRRWCAHTTCGNRHKVQQFRARRRALARPGRPTA